MQRSAGNNFALINSHLTYNCLFFYNMRETGSIQERDTRTCIDAILRLMND